MYKQLKQPSFLNRVIVFSGVFDPIHKGHLAIAKAASKLYGRQVVFLPERVPTHKHGSTSFGHRIAMLQAATIKNKKFDVMESPYKHHTISETLSWLQKKYPKGQHFGLLIGTDVAAYLMTWPKVEKLADYGVDTIIVTNRDVRSVYEMPVLNIPGVKVESLRSRYSYMASSIIRASFSEHQTSVPDGVAEYANLHHLYN